MRIYQMRERTRKDGEERVPMVDGGVRPPPPGRPHRPITRQESTLSRGFKVKSSLSRNCQFKQAHKIEFQELCFSLGCFNIKRLNAFIVWHIVSFFPLCLGFNVYVTFFSSLGRRRCYRCRNKK